jgi:predicted nucleic acid-binding protein
MTALDTNVVLDLLDGDERFAGSVLRVLDALGEALSIAPIVYAELCARPAWEAKDVRPFLDGAAITVDWVLGEAVWESAGVAFAAYARRRAKHGDEPRRLIADFAIGAHAERAGSLVTRDAAFYRRAFPKLKVVEP